MAKRKNYEITLEEIDELDIADDKFIKKEVKHSYNVARRHILQMVRSVLGSGSAEMQSESNNKPEFTWGQQVWKTSDDRVYKATINLLD